ncbi:MULTISPECIES: hypothetical protein [unclassified Acinetobacter]|uniref:hypothetical protein n=1 Tax=unclassified Acinetobacter TaxID=196816 RepID=UPI0012502111|nr:MULTISPECIES: hypothetical protein [unclassified Acinetobacter]
MCGGFVGKTLSTVTDAIGLTNTKQASQGYDAEAADAAAKDAAQGATNAAIAKRRKSSASTVLSSGTDTQKKTTLGG